jgi:biopolymer transport protein ExbB
MKSLLLLPILVLLILTAESTPASAAEDIRALHSQARETEKQLRHLAAEEKADAEREASRNREEIATSRASLETAIAAQQAAVEALTAEVASLEEEDVRLLTEEETLAARLAEATAVVGELIGVIRVNAKDILRLSESALGTAVMPFDSTPLQAIADQARFPGMDEVSTMIAALQQQIDAAAAVRMLRGPIVDRSGTTSEADILLLGNFTAAYRLDDEVGFLNPSPAGDKLFALAQLPTAAQQDQLRRYMEGRDEAVPMDITRGGALSQLIHRLTLQQQVEKGGPLIWPILTILVAGLLITAERLAFLLRSRLDGNALINRIETIAAEGWQQGRDFTQSLPHKPLARVVAAGLSGRKLDRSDLESALQEAILREIPPLERFLSTLAMLAAIAPLLGLLGTVTGMIATFQVITLYGTGDPRMMSGGISEALVTTMLGLSVAIPLMLIHTLLNRAVDTRIGEMEEKAVALINIVHRHRDE